MVDRSILRGVEKILGRLGSRLNTLARMAGVSAVSSSGPRVTATASVSDLESHPKVQVLEQYGFTSVPPAGSQGLMLCLGGDGAHPVLLGVGNPSTRLPGLGSGDAAMHVGSVATGARVVLRANGSIEIEPGPAAVVSVVPSGDITSPLAVARSTDPTIANTTDVASINTLIGAWNALATGGGGPLIVPPGPALTLATGIGRITAGGTGMVST